MVWERGEPVKDILRIIRYTWELKRYYLATAFFVVIIALLNQANPFLLKYLVDAVVARGSGSRSRQSTSRFSWCCSSRPGSSSR